MYESPRIRRLKNDLAALERLRAESSVFQFNTSGKPPHHYQITFKGRGLSRDHGKIRFTQIHKVEIKLGASYPRTIPELRWITPIHHPNISEIGMVCLGGYGTHWVPSVQLDELCTMLWDMVRYHNYDIRSPYNRDAALWVANQTSILFPTDPRPLRDLRVAQGRIEESKTANGKSSSSGGEAKMAAKDSNASSGWFNGREAKGAIDRVRQFMSRYARGGVETPEPSPAGRPDAVAPLPMMSAAVAEPAAASEPMNPPDPFAPDAATESVSSPIPVPASHAAVEEMVFVVDETETEESVGASPRGPADEEILFIE